MQIEHKKLIENGNTVIYLNVYLEDSYEFGKEHFNDAPNKKIVGNEIKKYIQKNIEYIKGAVIVIVVAVNGILIGALTMGPQNELKKLEESIYSETSKEIVLGNIDKKEKEEEKADEANNNKNEVVEETKKEEKPENLKVETAVTTQPTTKPAGVVTNSSTTNKKENQTVSSKPATSTTNKTQNSTNTSKPTSSTTTTTKPTTSTTTSTTTQNQSSTKVEESKPQGIYVKLNTNGVVQEIELETYIIGVVAAEMPASFNIEALKAQAIAARTYAMKRVSKGATLKNSTADQVYKTTAQMKATWGSSYSTYYNKIKNAVNATKGLVLKYNGEYIDAQYCSMTNGKTELPEYVWSFSRPYLQCVSSTWDTKVKNFEVTKTFTYDKVSQALGQTITQDTKIEVISKTVSDRVEKIKIGDKTYTGINVRSLLGLRSTDFTIKLNENNIQITTKGFGHGVGMSQYGAHMAANEGYTYRQILNHYYVGAQLVSI